MRSSSPRGATPSTLVPRAGATGGPAGRGWSMWSGRLVAWFEDDDGGVVGAQCRVPVEIDVDGGPPLPEPVAFGTLSAPGTHRAWVVVWQLDDSVGVSL